MCDTKDRCLCTCKQIEIFTVIKEDTILKKPLIIYSLLLQKLIPIRPVYKLKISDKTDRCLCTYRQTNKNVNSYQGRYHVKPAHINHSLLLQIPIRLVHKLWDMVGELHLHAGSYQRLIWTVIGYTVFFKIALCLTQLIELNCIYHKL